MVTLTNVVREFFLKKLFFPDFRCTHGRTCVYGRYAPVLLFFTDSGVRLFNFLNSEQKQMMQVFLLIRRNTDGS